MTNERLRVIVADDERPARSYLVAMLGTFENVEVVAEAADGQEAIEAIERVNPLPGGTYILTLSDGQQLQVSRSNARVLREQLLRL